MTQPNHPPPANPAGPIERKIPGLLWIAVSALGIITVLTLYSALTRGSAASFAAVVCNLALMLGLVPGHRWAYGLLIVFAVAGVAVSFGQGASQGLMVLIGNAVVVVPVLLSTRYFSRANNQTFRANHEHPSTNNQGEVL
jgi:hypothetical protein